MTNIEAKNFIENKLKQLFPQWAPTDLEYSEWLKRLFRYDYNKAVKAITDFVFERSINYKTPPTGKIFAMLKATAIDKTATRQREPLLVYEIIKKGRKYGFKFSLPSGNEPNESQKKALEIEAENIRLNMDRMYGFEHIIKWYIDVLPF